MTEELRRQMDALVAKAGGRPKATVDMRDEVVKYDFITVRPYLWFGLLIGVAIGFAVGYFMR